MHPLKHRPDSIHRSDGASLDLSMASNMAAQGEETQDMSQYGGNMAGMATLQPQLRPSDAEKWFQETNKNASTRGNVSFVDGKFCYTHSCEQY